MKVVFRLFTLALTIAMSLAGIGGDARTTAYRSWQTAQAQRLQFKRQERLLEVAIRESAIVRFKQDRSVTGKLTAFNSRNLTIDFEETSETIPFSEIKEVQFQGSIWIRGEKTLPPIRGIKILTDLPVTALKLGNPPIMASLSLKTMSSEGFERFSRNENCPCMISQIRLHNSEKMTVKLIEIP